jgi:hypothetical protein
MVVPLTTIPLTSGFQQEGGNTQNLITVNGIHIDGLCRQTESPGTGGKHRASYQPTFFTTGGETEAKVMVWTETGSISFKGQVGERINVPPGPPNYFAPTYTPPNSESDPVAGEGDHMFVAASNENADEIRATDPQVDDYTHLNGARQLNRFPGFNSGGGPIATSTGHLLFATFVAGFDTLGVYDKCVFEGVVHVIS